jgi:hypothetical protein
MKARFRSDGILFRGDRIRGCAAHFVLRFAAAA